MSDTRLIVLVPLQQPTADHFSSFDDHSSNLIGNLQLDADEEPRRVGATSRANSVRFDETANHGHWSKSSLDLLPRASSSMGGHLMSERSYSHKSDGRQSSTGQSVHSATSGRANSLTSFGMTPPVDAPGLAPGLFILGPVPAIIRCWLNTNFKHDTLIYAAVCSGSFTSYLDLHLIEHLGFLDHIVASDDGVRKIKLSVYLPEAAPVSASSRSSSPVPQLPSIAVDFTVIEQYSAENNPKAIQVVLGSDFLRAHNADMLFSTNQLFIYDDDRRKLQVPLVRPEDDRVFKYLSISSTSNASRAVQGSAGANAVSTKRDAASKSSEGFTAHASSASLARITSDGTITSSDDGASNGRRSLEQRSYVLSTSRTDAKDAQDNSSASENSQSGASPAIWSNWRRDLGEKTNSGSLDWASLGKSSSSNTSSQRRDTGIKVLKPLKLVRALSTSTSSPVTSQSRFFDDGKRRGEGASDVGTPAPATKRLVSGERLKENTTAPARTRAANPVGGGSAFAWLNSGGSK